MRVMVMVKATQESEAGEMPSEEMLAEMGNFNEELRERGHHARGRGAAPSSKGHRVRFSGKERTVVDGPFAETKELVAGFWVWQVKSMDEAIEWVKRCPNPMEGESEIEVRQVFEIDDFGDEATPEMREQNERLRAQTEGASHEQADRFRVREPQRRDRGAGRRARPSPHWTGRSSRTTATTTTSTRRTRSKRRRRFCSVARPMRASRRRGRSARARSPTR